MIDNLLRRSVPVERWGQPVTGIYDYALMSAATLTATGWLWLDHTLMLPALLVWFGLFLCFAWLIFQWRQGWRIGLAHRWACGVYALPVNDQTQEDFGWLLREIIEGGGEAMVCEARLIDGLSDADVRARFAAARDAEYQEIAKEARAVAKALEKAKSPDRLTEARPQVARLRARLAQVIAIDFFGDGILVFPRYAATDQRRARAASFFEGQLQGIRQPFEGGFAGDEPGREDLHPRLVVGELRLGDRAGEDPAGEGGDRRLRLAGQPHLALGGDRHPRAEVGDVGDDVGREDDDHRFPDRREQVQEALPLLGIEPRRRLVDDQETRIAEQRLGDAEALPHAAGEGAELARARVQKIRLPEQRVHDVLALALRRDSLENREVIEHLVGGGLGVQAELLREIPERAAQRVLVVQDVDVPRR